MIDPEKEKQMRTMTKRGEMYMSYVDVEMLLNEIDELRLKIKDMAFERDEFKKLSQEWMSSYDKVKQQYEEQSVAWTPTQGEL